MEVIESLSVDALGAYAWGERHARGAKYEQEIWAVEMTASYLF